MPLPEEIEGARWTKKISRVLSMAYLVRQKSSDSIL